MRLFATIALPLAALSLGACGGAAGNDQTPDADESPLAAAQPTGDPCRFVSATDMSAITTDTVTDLVREDSSCTYKTRHSDDLRINVKTTGGAKEMANARRATGVLSGMGAAVADKGGAGRDAAAILAKTDASPGVGDESLWGPVGILYARKGDAYVEVYPPNLHDPATHSGYPVIGSDEKRKISTAIARQVLARAGG